MIEPGPVVPQPPADPNKPASGQGPVSDPLPADTLRSNAQGRPITGPEDGFGKLWRKHYHVRLPGVQMTPTELIEYWRQEFGHIWPEGNVFYRPVAGLEEGEVALADLAMPAGTRLSSGVVVEDTEPTSFAFLTVRGHTFAGRITFSAVTVADDLVVRVESVVRAGDPLYEIGLPLGGHAREDEFWLQTLRNLAMRLGVRAEPEMSMTLLDGHRKWGNAANVRDNAYLRTAASLLSRPFRLVSGRLARKGGSS